VAGNTSSGIAAAGASRDAADYPETPKPGGFGSGWLRKRH
jgi:hypothetical protein